MNQSYYISKLYRHSKSLSMVVPQPVRIALGLKAGEHVVLQWNQTDGKFEFSKFVPAGARDVEAREKQVDTPAAISSW